MATEAGTEVRLPDLRGFMNPNSYDHIAEKWHSEKRGFQARKYVDLAIQGLDAGSRILDLGCGTGAPIAQYLIQQGFTVVGVDGSSKMLEIAGQVVPEAKLIQSDIVNVNIDERFNAVIAWDSIFHIDRTHHEAIFRKVFELLEPQGRLLLSAGGTGEVGFTSEMHGHTFYYSGYDPAETLDLLRGVGFRIAFWEVDDLSSKGHIVVVASKIACT